MIFGGLGRAINPCQNQNRPIANQYRAVLCGGIFPLPTGSKLFRAAVVRRCSY